MKAFRVKLSEGHSADSSQVKDGYLTNNGVIQLYKGGDARNKAMKFGGIAEPYGKAFTIAPMQMAQLALSEISIEIQRLLEDEQRFVSVTHKIAPYEPRNKDVFYFGNVFDTILEKFSIETYPISNEALADLYVLSALCTNYVYVQIITD